MNDVSLNWKVDDNYALKRNSESIKQPEIEEEEEEDILNINESELSRIFASFCKLPFQHLNDLYRVSHTINESNPSLIVYLKSINFFEIFANFLNKITQIDDKICSLKILSSLTSLSTDVCLDLIKGENKSLIFLKKNIFSEINEIRYMSFKCLKKLAQDSHECRLIIMFQNFLMEFHPLLLHCSDQKSFCYIGKIVVYLCLEQLLDEDIKILRNMAFIFMKNESGVGFACQILCSLSEKEKVVVNEYEYNSKNLIELLILVKNSRYLRYLMKFFVVRSGFYEEALAFFSSNIFQILFDNFIINQDNSVDNFNNREMKIVWTSWLIGAIFKKVNESIYQFIQIGYLDFFINFSINGNYALKSASIFVLSRALKLITVNKIPIPDKIMVDLNEVASVCIELIDTIDDETLISAFDLIIFLLSNQKSRKNILSLLNEESTYNIIATIAEQSEELNLREKAMEILNLSN